MNPTGYQAIRRQEADRIEGLVRGVRQRAHELLYSYQFNTQVAPLMHGLRFILHPTMWNWLQRSADQSSIGYAEDSFTGEGVVRRFMGLPVELCHTIDEGEVGFVMTAKHPSLQVPPAR